MFYTDDKNVDFRYNIEARNLHHNNGFKKIFSNLKKEVYKNNNNYILYYTELKKKGFYLSVLKNSSKNREIYVKKQFINICKNLSYLIEHIDIHSDFLSKGALILHSSYIIHQGNAILFTAPSGVGKSTQANLWKQYKYAEIINGDRSIIREKDGIIHAYGLPFSGSSQICKNKNAPIKAIILLEQGNENKIYDLKSSYILKFLLSQVAVNRWDKSELLKAMELIENIIGKVPIIRLSCLPDKGAVEIVDNYLSELEGGEIK
ncbi:MAG: hypothetical protein ACLS62_03645 [Terrisporobacter sp.]